MAASHSIISTSSGHYAFGGFGRQEFDVKCAGRDSRHLGLSPIGNPCDRSASPPQAPQLATEDIELLAQLIGDAPGEASLAFSHALLARYGSLAAIVRQFQADPPAQSGVSATIEQRLMAVSRAVSRLLRQEALEGPALSSPDILFACLRNEMADLPRETFRVLFLDSGNRLLADEVMWEGTVNRVQIHPREVVRRAIETSATALILVHNHPSGNPEPSRHDVAMTNKMVSVGSLIDIEVHDHIIVAKSGWFSMAEHGLIADAAWMHDRKISRGIDFQPAELADSG